MLHQTGKIPLSSKNVFILVYLILFRHENIADWVFNWCLSHKNGAHRLSSTNDLHEMQSGISLGIIHKRRHPKGIGVAKRVFLVIFKA